MLSSMSYSQGSSMSTDSPFDHKVELDAKPPPINAQREWAEFSMKGHTTIVCGWRCCKGTVPMKGLEADEVGDDLYVAYEGKCELCGILHKVSMHLPLNRGEQKEPWDDGFHCTECSEHWGLVDSRGRHGSTSTGLVCPCCDHYDKDE
jgi:hypothetical protein